MAVTFDIVRDVISLPPDKRKDFQVNDLIPWFRKKSELFKNLKTRLLVDLIKNLEFSHRLADDVIIKQGERGDCMYIILRGQVTIYINYDLKPKTDENGVVDESQAVMDLSNEKPETIRDKLGTFVTHLGAGATFGEIALLSDGDCVRTASIITNEATDLIIIDRTLYNRSVKAVLKAEFEEKAGFIASNPLFSNWAPKYKKQLTMALQKETYSYNEYLTRQGNPLEAIYYIISGEVRVTMTPAQHVCQYKKLFAQTMEDSDLSEKLLDMACKRKRGKTSSVEICYLGVNEPIGDVEMLAGLNTYAQNSVCTQRTEVLVLELKHYERLVSRRNPKTVNAMRELVELRLTTRLHPPHIRATVPLLSLLLGQAAKENQAEKARERARARELERPREENTSRDHEMINNRGLLVDMYGPGTVFYKIRQDYEKNLLKKQKQNRKLAGNRVPDMKVPQNEVSPSREPRPLRNVDAEREEIAAGLLEEKLKSWMTGAGAVTLPKLGDPRYMDLINLRKPRVCKLHHADIEMDELKQGKKIFMKEKRDPLPRVTAPADSSYQQSRELPDKGRHKTKSQLAYYRMALNSPVLKISQAVSE